MVRFADTKYHLKEIMKKIAILIAIFICSSIAYAEPVPAPDCKKAQPENSGMAAMDMFKTDANGDMLMPTLEEMLGEPIDNLSNT